MCLRTFGGGRVWRLGVGLGSAHSEKAFGIGVLGEMKKPSQALLLQIFRERNTVGLEERVCEGDWARWGNVRQREICFLKGSLISMRYAVRNRLIAVRLECWVSCSQILPSTETFAVVASLETL